MPSPGIAGFKVAMGTEMVMKENDDDLDLFLEMRSRQIEGNVSLRLLQNSDRSDGYVGLSGSKPDNSPESKTRSTIPFHDKSSDELLDSDIHSTDYKGLLTPPSCTPLVPSPLEMESHETRSHVKVPNAQSGPENPHRSKGNRITEQQKNSSGDKVSSSVGNRRSSSAGRRNSTTSRSATPTGRSILNLVEKPSRSSTPTSRPNILPSTKPAAVPAGSNGRSSTPSSRLPSKSATLPGQSPMYSPRSSATKKSGPSTLKKPMILERPASTSKNRTLAPAAKSSSSFTDTTSNRRIGLKSCSPMRGQAQNGNARHGQNTVLSRSRRYPSSGDDDVNPVLIGSKMVERVVNMRKLAPPKQDDHLFNHNNSSGNSSSSRDSSGFGRTLSKKSLDMALRHMDIRGSIPGNLRPVVTKVPASSVYSNSSVRSSSSKSRTTSVSDSPFATSRSSNSSSEHFASHYLNSLEGSETEVNES